ncbi:MAG: Clp protease ClpS [Flavobacteriaceae bacterium]|nr:Clp protease ClpS [Flavobacteriaceae bacterium]|tara:strand:- start:11922 stop:12242 length:321 start_codon:yes stop_codon:yes gene_type:complete
MLFYYITLRIINSNSPLPNENPDEDVDAIVKVEREHELILYNDDVNTFDHVIETLISVCDHTLLQAQQCAYIVHFNGKCVVKTGPISDLEPRCIKLLEAGLSAEIV